MLEMFLISVASTWTAMFLLVWLIVVIIASERDSFILGISTLIAGVIIADWLFVMGITAAIAASPLMAIGYILFHLCAGIAYAGLYKLPEFVKEHKDVIKSDYASWMKLGDNRHLSFNDFLNSVYYRHSVRKNKDRVASWVLLWPFSLLWELCHKPFIWLWNVVYTLLGETFEKINHKAAQAIIERKK